MENKNNIHLSKPLMDSEQKTPINLKWENLNVEVITNVKSQGKKSKTILKNSTGYVAAGQTLAIMGPSGAGKTTLLSILTKRLTASRSHKISGQVLLNNSEYSAEEFSNTSAYILQNDILMETLTVRETIEFAAKLKLKGTEQEKARKVNSIISKLKLEKCQNNYIGGAFVKGISGGERKRTNIGVELVTDPQLIILDEPTSGLDSFTAYLIVNLLKQMAKNENKTIIFTIHSPSSEIYNSLDRIFLLGKGCTVYQGNSHEIVPYMQKQGIVLPMYCNPADKFMDILASQGDFSEGYQGAFSPSSYSQNIQPQIENEMSKIPQIHILNFGSNNYANNFFYESKLIALRSFRNFYRSPVLLRAKFAQLIVMYFVTSSLWWMIGNDQPSDLNINSVQQWVMNIVGVLFFMGIACFMNINMTLTITFPSERSVFLKEENSKSYRVSSYFFGKLLIELPYVLIYPFLFIVVCYWLLDLRKEGFILCALTLILMSLIGNGLGLMTGAMLASPQAAVALQPIFLLPFMMFAGYYSNLESLPKWISWFQYLSPFRYMQNALLINQFDGVQYNDFDPVSILSYDLTFWQSIGILIGLSVGFHLLALLFLKARARKLT